MKLLSIVFLSMIFSSPLGSNFSPSSSDVSAEELVGTWQIDLRPSPDAQAYYAELVITSVKGTDIKGTFYGSKIENGKVNTTWGKVHFAFVTRDGSSLYHTSGEIVDGKLSGTTHALGRSFLSVWSGTAASK